METERELCIGSGVLLGFKKTNKSVCVLAVPVFAELFVLLRFILASFVSADVSDIIGVSVLCVFGLSQLSAFYVS